MIRTSLPADQGRLRSAQIRLVVEDGLVRIEVGGLFDGGVATAVRTSFHEIGALADAVLLDLGAVTDLQVGFDLSGLVDEIQRHCWISGCRLRLTVAHPSVVAALGGHPVSNIAVITS